MRIFSFVLIISMLAFMYFILTCKDKAGGSCVNELLEYTPKVSR
jgi:hypothetical protein